MFAQSGRGAYYRAKYGGRGRGGRHNVSGDGGPPGHAYGQRQFQEEDDESAGGAGVRPSSAPYLHQKDLSRCLISLEGKSYGAYKDLIGCWEVNEFTLYLDKVQSDPFAPPSRFRLRLPQAHAQFPPHLYSSYIRNVALCDFLTRKFFETISRGGIVGPEDGAHHGGWHDSKPDTIRIDKPGQYVFPRSSMIINSEYVEARCTIGLPARGRRIEGRRAATLLCSKLPQLVRSVMHYSSLDAAALKRHVECVEDQESLRSQLHGRNLSAFVANGACLPRRSGVEDTPMTRQQEPNLVLFQSPPDLECEFTLPNSGTIRGMGIPRGITLIVGGGFHGKSTMLEALQMGVWNKIPGDGREFVITEPNAVKIRAEDGRVVTSVDISPFISNLPFGKSTDAFSSADASGSTSQAANIMEALEFGATALLIDEDTCATNFMIRDCRMQALVAKEKEPITPFLFRVKRLFTELDISTIMVIGGSGDFFEVADLVLQFDKYQAYSVTKQAKDIAQEFENSSAGKFQLQTALSHANVPFGAVRERTVAEHCLRPNGKVKVGGTRSISYGTTNIDVSGVEQLAEASQTRAIACFIQQLAKNYERLRQEGKRTLRQMIEAQYKMIVQASSANDTKYPRLDWLSTWDHPVGDLALPRELEIGFAISRLRGLRIRDTA
ncbi:hypothetical protein, conserved [Eimeria tenella]|uniref:ATPase n=1 Tax=Eimeria tenella TaxID=5802 RepID=U6KIN7_EIMTE|nr:hypothetical protein, conserved [Eimeria tenella]CDJ37804.1 hypothetical protein, conserved [Eimeria tenella]|eukprot:XP_013228642.1 hypothetical protein, conserved [Eimeria tenella]